MANDYIRREDAVDAVKHAWTKGIEPSQYIESLEPADVVPVRHGKWTHKPDVYGVVYCSKCNYELHANSTSFCPNCGAKMDGEE